MLEQLDGIEWLNLSHAYGSATDIPDLIRSLTSQHPEEWTNALFHLYMAICHQTVSTYDATLHAVPFLIELLHADEVRCKGKILVLLGDITRAWADTEVLTHQIRARIWAEYEFFLDLLSDVDIRLRVVAPYILATLIECATNDAPKTLAAYNPHHRITSTFLNRLGEESEPLVRASIVFGLQSVIAKGFANIDILENLLVSPVDKQTQIASAICLSKLSDETPETTIDILVESLANYPTTQQLFAPDINASLDRKYHPILKTLYDDIAKPQPLEDFGAIEDIEFLWQENIHRSQLVACLCKTSPRLIEIIFPALLNMMHGDNEHSMETVSAPILRYVFGNQAVPNDGIPKNLTSFQRAALEAIYYNLEIWTGRSGPIPRFFHEMGLPEGRSEWAKMLAIDEPPISTKQAKAILDNLVRYRLRLKNDIPLDESQYLKVKSLSLRNIGTNSFIPLLDRLKNLAELDLANSQVTSEGLVTLPILQDLEELQLFEIKLTEEVIHHISQLTKLTVLGLSSTGVKYSWLVHLQSLKQLGKLVLRNNRFSENEVIELRAMFPSCKIFV